MPKKSYISGGFFNLDVDKEIYYVEKEVLKTAGGIVSAIDRRLKEAAKNIKEDMKKSMRNTPKTGKKYGDHIASSPGKPPAVQTKNLLDSIMHVISRHQAEVGVTTGATYGKYLESGAVRKKSILLPRPFLQPAVEKEWPNMIDKIEIDIERLTDKLEKS